MGGTTLDLAEAVHRLLVEAQFVQFKPPLAMMLFDQDCRFFIIVKVQCDVSLLLLDIVSVNDTQAGSGHCVLVEFYLYSRTSQVRCRQSYP